MATLVRSTLRNRARHMKPHTPVWAPTLESTAWSVLLVLFLASGQVDAYQLPSATHPLDALSKREIEATSSIIRSASKVTATTRFVAIRHICQDITSARYKRYPLIVIHFVCWLNGLRLRIQ